MKKRLPGMLLVTVLASGVLHAQNMPGVWQGTLKLPQRDLRVVFKISLEDDKLKAMMYSIDQPGPGIVANTIAREGSTVKVGVTAIGGGFEGKLSADGNSLVGTWTQGGGSLPLTLIRAAKETEWTIPEPPPPPKRMPADAKPAFEVSTIKPSPPDGRFSLLVNQSGMLNTTSTSVYDLIKFAYDLHPQQIKGGPAWAESERFDISGKPDTPGIPNVTQLKMMVRGLLTERFQLTFHREKKELSVYAISVGKGGSKMTKSDPAAGALPGFGGGPRGLNVRNATITEFASMLQANVVEKPVVDQTGFGETRYDFVLKWTPDGPSAPGRGGRGGGDAAPSAPAPTDNLDAPPDLFTAFQQQLGLKLESTKAPVDVVMIDKLEKPSAN